MGSCLRLKASSTPSSLPTVCCHPRLCSANIGRYEMLPLSLKRHFKKVVWKIMTKIFLKCTSSCVSMSLVYILWWLSPAVISPSQVHSLKKALLYVHRAWWHISITPKLLTVLILLTTICAIHCCSTWKVPLAPLITSFLQDVRHYDHQDMTCCSSNICRLRASHFITTQTCSINRDLKD